jgi:hypothetical protein
MAVCAVRVCEGREGALVTRLYDVTIWLCAVERRPSIHLNCQSELHSLMKSQASAHRKHCADREKERLPTPRRRESPMSRNCNTMCSYTESQSGEMTISFRFIKHRRHLKRFFGYSTATQTHSIAWLRRFFQVSLLLSRWNFNWTDIRLLSRLNMIFLIRAPLSSDRYLAAQQPLGRKMKARLLQS